MRNFKSTGLPNTYNTPINTIDDIQFVVFELDGLGNIDFQVKGTVKNTTDINQIVEPLLLTDFNGGTAPTTFNDNNTSIDFRTLSALPAGWRWNGFGTVTFNATTGLVLSKVAGGLVEVSSNIGAINTGTGVFSVSWISAYTSTGSNIYVVGDNEGMGISKSATFWRVLTPDGNTVDTSVASDSNEHTFKIQRLANGNVQYYVDTTLIYTYTGVSVESMNTIFFELIGISGGTLYIKTFSADLAGRVLLKTDVRGLSSIILSGGVNTGVVGVNGYSE